MTRCSTWLSVLAVVAVSGTAFADDAPYRINVGRDYTRYTVAELQRRVFDLERAVMQLQERIYHLESAPPPPPVVMQPPWTCSVSAFGKTYVHTAGSRGEAEALVRSKCASASHQMHCTAVNCSQ